MNDDTNDHDSSTEEDGFPATKLVTECEDEAGSDEATNRVDGRDEPLVRAVILDLWEVVGEVRRRHDAGHDTLVVAEQEEIRRRHGRDQFLQRLAGRAPVRGHAGVVVLVPHCLLTRRPAIVLARSGAINWKRYGKPMPVPRGRKG